MTTTLVQNELSAGSSGPARGDLRGAVLCGGASRRMGRDKAALRLGEETLLERAVGSLRPLCGEVVLACGSADRFPDAAERRVLDAVPDGGPLAGLASALAGHGGWLLTLACDMPSVGRASLAALVDRASRDDVDVVLARHGDRLEPLLAAYHARALPAIERALARGDRRLVSFHADVRLATVAVGEDDARNVNTPEDFERLGGELA